MLRFFLIISFAVLISSCRKFLDIPFPQDQVSGAAVFGDDSTAQAAVYGIYGQLMTTASVFMNGSVTIYPGLSADELYNTSANATSDQFYQNALQPNESAQVSNGLWKWGYTNIFNCNSLLNGLANSYGVSSTLRDQFKGEALAARALCYFYLVNLYGEVPLVLSTNYAENSVQGNASIDSVYRKIIDDLKEAITLLPTSYSTGKTRITASAAKALLARVYLYRKEFLLAEQLATDLIENTPGLILEDDLNKVFLTGSRENILGLYPVSLNQNTGAGFALLPSTAASAKPAFGITPALMSAFEAGDKRRTAWVSSKTVGGQPTLYPYKYKVKINAVVTEVNVIFRLAEQYLIRAEARLEQGNLAGALSDLNRIRKRAGLTELSLTSPADVMNAIMQERRIELMVEMGHRWLDLKRTGRATQVLAPLKAGWQDTDQLYPIPQSEIDRNPFLKQNTGY